MTIEYSNARYPGGLFTGIAVEKTTEGREEEAWKLTVQSSVFVDLKVLMWNLCL